VIGRVLSSRRALAGIVAALAAALIGAALVLQFRQGLEPCPLCILQRYAYVLVALLSLLAAILPRLLSRGLAWLGILVALAGAGTGAWHVWLQLHPPVVSSCGASLQFMVANLPLGHVLPRIFKGFGDCSDIDWSFLGITIPGWSAIWLVVLALLLYRAQGRKG